jgi:hypothetical protein
VVTDATISVVRKVCTAMEALRVDGHLRTQSVHEVGWCFISV